MPDKQPTIIVEHLDPELEDWQSLEYKCIAEECASTGFHFLLSGLPSVSAISSQLSLPTSNLTEESVEKLYATNDQRSRVCLLDPKAEKDLSPEDGKTFDVFLFGGILGDDPPRDRTGELRRLGFAGRRLGAEQMTTDTAARVTRMVVAENKQLNKIPYIDRPDVEIPPNSDTANGAGPSESVSMPFKYVRDENGQPTLPSGMLELLAKDADKDILDLL